MTPYYEQEGIIIYHGDCRAVMPHLPQVVDVVIADPPYGCGKAEWDDEFPVQWYQEAKRVARMVIIITGSCGLKDSVALVGDDFIDVIAARNMNGMTRGPIGFGNWLAAVVAVGKPTQGINAFDFCVRGSIPDHPSPKPLEYMTKLISRCTKEGQLVLDPFAGSGTTLVAAALAKRKAVGIELSEKYCEIAARRVDEALHRTGLFAPARVKNETEADLFALT